jgi:predicted ATPase
MMQLSFLRHGVSDFSPYAFACWGFAMTVTYDFDEAFRFATLALKLMCRFGEECRTIGLVHGLLYHIKKPILETTAPTLRAYHMAFTQGDLAYAGQASALYIAGRFVAGSRLEGLVADSFTICDELKAYNQ